jgi:SAM-dependent methyltransferase
MAVKRRWPDPGPEAIEVPDDQRWNHNLHYHSVIVDAIPTGAQRALDVGCGEGILTRVLRAWVPSVTGLDIDAPSLELARRQGPADVDYVLGDLLTHPLEPRSFDVVTCVAALHHLDFAAGLRRMADLTAPGGVLAAVGVARRRLPHDLPWDVIGAVTTRVLRHRHGEWHTPAPKTWPPPLTFEQHRRVAAELLPGARFRRHILWRWSLVWRRPTGSPT